MTAGVSAIRNAHLCGLFDHPHHRAREAKTPPPLVLWIKIGELIQ
jgi:hypothetical protein